jgi:hypothetical protein
MGRGYERLERLRAALISLREIEVECAAAVEAKRQEVQNAIADIKRTGGDVLATGDEGDIETPEQLTARKVILWHQACSDLEPILHYCRASQRILGAQDLGKSVSAILYECLNAVRQEFDPD